MKFINRHSYIIFSAAILVGVVFLLSERLSFLWLVMVVLVLGAVLYGGHRMTGISGDGISARTAVEAAGGKFTLVEFYSDY